MSNRFPVPTQFRKTDLFPSLPQGKPGEKIVIAVDGPAASGKGTFAKRLAERLGYAYLDTGALYRAVAFAALELKADVTQWSDVRQAVDIVLKNLTPELLANPALRSAEVGAASSQVAAIPEVRAALLQYQRDFALNPPGHVGGAVLDGRDIGTVVCPEAQIKFFVTASPEERARRRFKELEARDPSASYAGVLADLKARDERDSTRAVAPTKAAPDSYTIDTTGLNPAEALDEGIAIIRARFIEQLTPRG
jgi:cytidylate kinase